MAPQLVSSSLLIEGGTNSPPYQYLIDRAYIVCITYIASCTLYTSTQKRSSLPYIHWTRPSRENMLPSCSKRSLLELPLPEGLYSHLLGVQPPSRHSKIIKCQGVVFLVNLAHQNMKSLLTTISRFSPTGLLASEISLEPIERLPARSRAVPD